MARREVGWNEAGVRADAHMPILYNVLILAITDHSHLSLQGISIQFQTRLGPGYSHQGRLPQSA